VTGQRLRDYERQTLEKGKDRMFARKTPLLRILTVGFSVLVLLASTSIQTAQAGCRHCGSGGGGGGGGGGGSGQLTQAEIDGLTYMREEEKLARDAYLTLYAKWHLSIFSNIASSEVMHMSRIKDVLDRYGLPDPAAGQAVGEFTNPILQQLYNDLMVQGSQSSTEALKVGVTIEEVDIQDLETYIASTNKTDILQVYNNLLNASYHHLSAFNNQLGQ
jgi:hypothetical protein